MRTTTWLCTVRTPGKASAATCSALRCSSELTQPPNSTTPPSTLTFSSERVTRVGEGRLRIDGSLTIRGVTRPVTLEVREEGRGRDPWGGERLAFSASTTIDRRDFGLTWNQALETGGVLVGNEVRISIELEAVRS